MGFVKVPVGLSFLQALIGLLKNHKEAEYGSHANSETGVLKQLELTGRGHEWLSGSVSEVSYCMG